MFTQRCLATTTERSSRRLGIVTIAAEPRNRLFHSPGIHSEGPSSPKSAFPECNDDSEDKPTSSPLNLLSATQLLTLLCIL